eukprot:CAMPEP_0119358038 /NCGR_PEP_ID=MMETSP1334-20130426/6329_1 /TAXON_ID=127549 /ORGANISM="Calcidiscus leptoporus, Strain RCC1130" /LENGTH=253 /DNA_ID=CAMNT_0007372437 /DNA_START=1 /DNA_END=759 /DNA_ORIENTATION=-
MLVVSGLAVAAVGSATIMSLDESFSTGLLAVLVGTGMHALVYVLQEMTLVKEATPLEPSMLCGLIGLMGTAVIGVHAALFTAPQWHTLVRPRPGLIRIFASSYGGKTLTDFLHGWAYFHLMGQLGATSMSVMKAAVAASSFFTSVAFFCNPDCCVARELPPSMACPSQPAGRAAGSAFFCHYSPAQCFSTPKAASLALVLAGVLLYNRCGIGAAEGEASSSAEAEAIKGNATINGAEKTEDSHSLMKLATWRW